MSVTFAASSHEQYAQKALVESFATGLSQCLNSGFCCHISRKCCSYFGGILKFKMLVKKLGADKTKTIPTSVYISAANTCKISGKVCYFNIVGRYLLQAFVNFNILIELYT